MFQSIVGSAEPHNLWLNLLQETSFFSQLYCSLTVFTNPIAVYCVGVYAELSSDQSTVIFSEDNFLSALCNAFDFSHALDFLNTVHSILLSNKLRQKDVSFYVLKIRVCLFV